MPMDTGHGHQTSLPTQGQIQQCPTNEAVWRPNTEVVAMYTFQGRSNEDLPFQKGDVLTIVKNTSDPNWYRARDQYHNKEGMIPAVYVQERRSVRPHTMPWYHGKVTRLQAEDLLYPRKDGLFLIRDSNNYKGHYTLCLCCGPQVEHYHIKYQNNQLTIDDEVYFKNLPDLVEHYMKDEDGLCTKLITPLTKEGSKFVSANPDDFLKGGWAVPLSDLQIGESIGKGEFGDVFKGFYKNKPVAIKQLKDKNKAEQTFLQEASLMTSLRHPNLVQLIGLVLQPEIYLITEFMGKGNLIEYLRSRGRNVITKKESINFAFDTCSAMSYLEEKNLVHRDLAARNVLINEEGTSKVSDFGLAKHTDYSTDGGKFPIKWTSPEAVRENKFTTKSDVWSFGIFLWEIYSFGRVPYPRIPLADVVMHVEKGYRMEAPEGCPPEIYAIMKETWAKNPSDRPTFRAILEKLNHIRSITV